MFLHEVSKVGLGGLGLQPLGHYALEKKEGGYNGMLRTYVLLLKMRAIKSTL